MRGFVVGLVVVAAGATAVAQRRGGGGSSAASGADAGASQTSAGGGGDDTSWAAVGGIAVDASAARPDASANGATSASADASAGATSAMDAGASATGRGGRGARGGDAGAAVAAGGNDAASGAAAGGGTPNAFNLPMVQRGSGAVIHFPIPEQQARNEVPVFAQVRSSAPLDHVSMFYRGSSSGRFREVRMNPMGQNLGLANGYGAQIPCEDSFPPAVEYYVAAFDTSGAAVGTAGTATAPIRMPIVIARTHAVIPTLPGAAAPRNCGSLVVSSGGGSFAGSSGATSGRGDAGAASTEPEFGTGDLGEPCRRDNDCRRGLRCGASTRTCVFRSTN